VYVKDGTSIGLCVNVLLPQEKTETMDKVGNWLDLLEFINNHTLLLHKELLQVVLRAINTSDILQIRSTHFLSFHTGEWCIFFRSVQPSDTLFGEIVLHPTTEKQCTISIS
jgi:hypothetical protein